MKRAGTSGGLAGFGGLLRLVTQRGLIGPELSASSDFGLVLAPFGDFSGLHPLMNGLRLAA